MRLALACVTCRQLSTSSCSNMPAAPLLAWLPTRIARLISSGASRSTSTKCQNSVFSGPRQGQPQPEDPVREDRMIAELNPARAQCAEPPLDLGHRRLVIRLEQ